MSGVVKTTKQYFCSDSQWVWVRRKMNQLAVRLNVCLYQERNKKANQKHSHLHAYISDHFDPLWFLSCLDILLKLWFYSWNVEIFPQFGPWTWLQSVDTPLFCGVFACIISIMIIILLLFWQLCRPEIQSFLVYFAMSVSLRAFTFICIHLAGTFIQSVHFYQVVHAQLAG